MDKVNMVINSSLDPVAAISALRDDGEGTVEWMYREANPSTGDDDYVLNEVVIGAHNYVELARNPSWVEDLEIIVAICLRMCGDDAGLMD